jgi:hypothetical protein
MRETGMHWDTLKKILAVLFATDCVNTFLELEP